MFHLPAVGQQAAAIVLPLFLIAAAAVVATNHSNSLRGHELEWPRELVNRVRLGCSSIRKLQRNTNEHKTNQQLNTSNFNSIAPQQNSPGRQSSSPSSSSSARFFQAPAAEAPARGTGQPQAVWRRARRHVPPDNRTIQFNHQLGQQTTNLQLHTSSPAPPLLDLSHDGGHDDDAEADGEDAQWLRALSAAETNQSSSQVPRNNNQVQPKPRSQHNLGLELAAAAAKQPARRQAPGAGNAGAAVAELSLPSQQAAAAAAAYALAQEDRKAADKLNAELCRNFSVGVQHETGGIFSSPNYPNPYPANLICTKLIEAPSGYFVVLEFRDQFNIEEAGTDCDNDKIEIRDGRFGYSKVLARYCGQRFPPEVRSSDEAMWLRFISDGSITHTGFKAVYRFEKQKNTKPLPPFECRFNVTSMLALATLQSSPNNATDNKTGIHSGIIRNTDVPEKLIEYSKQYNVSLECIWNITVTPGWKIYLTFSSYEINRPNDCDSNFIEIYEENLTEENQTVKFCGTRTEPQQSRSNVFNIRHHAVPAASGSRFEIIYTAFRERGPAGCDTAREFDCDDGTCIHESLKCDGTVNCKYRYDEASEPGPCAIGEDVQPFFETEHMVIILIVFLTLVSGMCASIIISCWGKIQERRRRKLEYHMRKSREASMEGQINKVDQLYDAGMGQTRTQPPPPPGANNGKLRLTAPVAPSEPNHIQQQLLRQQKQFNQNSSNGQQRLVQLEPEQQQRLLYHHQQQQQQQHQIYGQQMGASNPSLAAVQNGRLMHGDSQQERSVSVYGSRSKLSDQQAKLAIYGSKQQSLANRLDQSLDRDSAAAAAAAAAADQAMLNTLVRNQLVQQQQQQQKRQQQYIASAMYTQQTDSQDSSSQQALVGPSDPRYQQQQQPASSTMPKLFKQNTIDQQQLIFDSQQHQRRRQFVKNGAPPYQQQQQARNLTLSAMHQPSLSGSGANNNSMTLDTAALRQQQQQQLMRHPNQINANIYGLHQQPLSLGDTANLSSSITCCNSLGADCLIGGGGGAGETPLISDLVRRNNNNNNHANNLKGRTFVAGQVGASLRNPMLAAHMGGQLNAQQLQLQQQQQQQQQQQVQGLQSASIPRSISAYQLSKAQLRQNQQQQHHQLIQAQQQQQQQQLAQLQQQQQHPSQLSYKSMSDAGHAQRHQPPNHSLSYPHACTGDHAGADQVGGPAGVSDSPALPPPPPPPNLLQSSRSNSAAAAAASQPDNKRAAFKLAHLDASQLTGDTLPDSELLLAAGQLPALGSMQSDELSTESDATFGMLIDSAGNASFGLPPAAAAATINSAQQQQQQQAINQQRAINQLMIGQGYKAAANQLPSGPQSLIVAHQQQQQQQQQQLNQLQQANYIAHLNDCNLVRRHQQRQEAMAVAAAASGSSSGRQQMLSSSQPMICDCGALERANQMRQRLAMNQQQQQQQQQQHQQSQLMQLQHQQQQQRAQTTLASLNQQRQSLLQSTDTRDFDLEDSEEAKAMPYGYAGNLQQPVAARVPSRFNRFRQQSSELTADDDDDEEEVDDHDDDEPEVDDPELDEDDEEDLEVDQVCRRLAATTNRANKANKLANNVVGPIAPLDGYDLDDDDDGERLAGAAKRPAAKQHGNAISQTPTASTTVVRRHNEAEPLRDDGSASKQRHLSGSRASLSQHSCTCGSQSKLNQLEQTEASDESSNDNQQLQEQQLGAAQLNGSASEPPKAANTTTTKAGAKEYCDTNEQKR